MQPIQQYGTPTLCSDVQRVMKPFRVLLAAFPKICGTGLKDYQVANAPHSHRPTCKKFPNHGELR
jgi:hypothetical protein